MNLSQLSTLALVAAFAVSPTRTAAEEVAKDRTSFEQADSGK
jgi:hypothetical protein